MGTKNNPESFVSSVISSNTNTFSSSGYHNENTGKSRHITNASKTIQSKSFTYSGKHRLPMQLSRPPAGGSIGVSVITPAAGAQPCQKEVHYKQQQQQHPSQHQHFQHVQTIQARNSNDGHSRTNVYSNSNKMATQHSTGVTITPISNAYLPGKSKMVTSTPTASIVHSHTQHLPKYLSSSRFLVNTDKGDIYLNDDCILGEITDKRTQYCNYLPPDYQHVLQDHSYSQLPESPPPPLPPSPIHQRTTFNGQNRISTSVGPTKVTLNNNRIVNVSGGVGYSSYSNNVSSGRLNSHVTLPLANNSMNYSSVTAVVNSVASNLNNSGTSVIAVNPKKNLQSNISIPATLSNIPKGLLKTGIISDKPEESDLSEDDRIPDPHGEETETAPEAEGEEESVTRCICDFQHDDGYMISCDKCLAWQHVDCMGIDWHQIPDEYQCEKCQPRYVDKRRAVEIQKKKIAEKLCVGVNDDSDSSDTPISSSRNKTQTKRKYKGKRTSVAKRKIVKESKEMKPKKSLGSVRKRQQSDSILSFSPPLSPSLSSSTNMTAEKKKQLLIERKQMLLEKKQITKKRSMRKQAQSTKRYLDKSKLDDDHDQWTTSTYTEKDEDNGHSIQQVREWVDRYEEAVTNHYSQELRARLNASQVNGVSSDLKFSASLRSVEKCRTSLLSTGGKIVLATCSLSSNQPIIELRGKYMYTGAESFKQSKISPITPYVFYYKLPLPKQDIEICVDCRSYGNFARFVRRSCKPNAELRHCIRKTSLHLYLIATQPLKKNSEILIGHYSPETAGSCVCGSTENCTAAKTPYPVILSSRSNEKSKELQLADSSSPVLSETNAKNKKMPVNTDKSKKKLKEERKKLTKEKRRGRRRSPSLGSNSDQESSSRDQSPSVPARLTVSLWGKPAVIFPANQDVAHKSGSDNESQPDISCERTISPAASPAPSSVEPVPTSTVAPIVTDVSLVTTNKSIENAIVTTVVTSLVTSIRTTTTSTESGFAAETICSNAVNSSTNKQNTRTTRQSDYARKEKQQLDMPLFFQTPNNHKLTREEKKIQAIMKAFEAMEKSEARKQESQKHRRESTSESDTPSKKSTPCRKNLKNRKSVNELRDRDEKPRKLDENGRVCKDQQIEDDDDAEGAKENSVDNSNTDVVVKVEEKNENEVNIGETNIIKNGKFVKELKIEERENIDDDDDNEERENIEKENTMNMEYCVSEKSLCQSALVNHKLDSDDKVESREANEESNNESIEVLNKTKRNEKLKIHSPCKQPRTSRPTPKARATPRSKVTKGKKRRSESDQEGSGDVDVSDIRERTRSAVQRQKKAANNNLGKDEKCLDDSKNIAGHSPGKFRKIEDPILSPYSTPPKSRERLDSSSSSGGTPPTPVSDTCLLVASAIGHLTDFKFPNTKKELMNAWFKEERKPDDENTGKLPSQEGNNEYAKKRWLRQAISEEGDNSIPRPEESLSPTGEYGGPLKKRRFARESVSDQTENSLPSRSFINSNLISFDDEDDISSSDAFPSHMSEGDGVAACHPTSLQIEVEKIEEPQLLQSTTGDISVNKLNAVVPEVDEEIAKVASESVADTIASILAPVNSKMSPPRPPSVPPPRTPSPPPVEPEVHVKENHSPLVCKKKLSLTEYQQRKGGCPPVIANPCEPVGDVAQEVPTLVAAPSPTVDPSDALGRSSSRSSITSSSCSEEEDNSHAASAQVIARSLMIESRHLSYGPQASALFNSIRNGTGSQLLYPKQNAAANGAPLPRENLADRLKREFDVHVQEDENEKNKTMPPPLSPIKIHVQMPPQMPPQMSSQIPSQLPQFLPDLTLNQKDLHVRLKKVQPPPPPPPLPCIPPPLLPPLPEPPQLFAPTYYPFPVSRVRTPFFAAPPPPPPGPPPVPLPSLPPGPPPPPPPPK